MKSCLWPGDVQVLVPKSIAKPAWLLSESRTRATMSQSTITSSGRKNGSNDTKQDLAECDPDVPHFCTGDERQDDRVDLFHSNPICHAINFVTLQINAAWLSGNFVTGVNHLFLFGFYDRAKRVKFYLQHTRKNSVPLEVSQENLVKET
jgi:hypothetical protein